MSRTHWAVLGLITFTALLLVLLPPVYAFADAVQPTPGATVGGGASLGQVALLISAILGGIAGVIAAAGQYVRSKNRQGSDELLTELLKRHLNLEDSPNA